MRLPCPERSAKELLEAEPLEELRQKAAEVAFGASLCGLTILRCAAHPYFLILWWALSYRSEEITKRAGVDATLKYAGSCPPRSLRDCCKESL